VQDEATRWRWTYNHERPNIALGGITPMSKWTVARCFDRSSPSSNRTPSTPLTGSFITS
jgi:hypothetical protein